MGVEVVTVTSVAAGNTVGRSLQSNGASKLFRSGCKSLSFAVEPQNFDAATILADLTVVGQS